jgi:solute carrier family 45 protein 1/2/4
MEKLDGKKEYGSFDRVVSFEEKPQHVQGNPFVKATVAPSTSALPNNGNQYEEKYLQVAETTFSQASPLPVEEGQIAAGATKATLINYLWTIVYMPYSLRILCLTNLFCWMSLVCYSLYFTDFVGEAVFGGDPSAAPGSEKRRLYDQGVQFGCWGMALYSLSCSIYSTAIEKLVKRFRAKPVYIGGQLVYSIGMIFMAIARSTWGVIFFSWSAGIMYSTLFTMPYLIVAHYHETDCYSEEDRNKTDEEKNQDGLVRGLGTDVGIVSTMVFLAQFILSLTMGSIIQAVNSTTAVIIAASVLSFCGAISASFVTYLDL